MSITSCLVLKPYPSDAILREKQAKDIKVIQRVIKEAGLVIKENEQEGLLVKDITVGIIRRVHEVDILVVDVNCYEKNVPFRVSPYLYYLLACRHAKDNCTILVAENLDHLPASLKKYHTLSYSSDTYNDSFTFVDSFKEIVEDIRQGKNVDADNPLQEYLMREKEKVERQKSEEEKESLKKDIARYQAEKAAREAYEAQQQPGDQPRKRITFVPIPNSGGKMK